MKQRISVLLISALTVCLMATFVVAQTKQSNLTGTWKMNADKSKFERGGPSGITLKFDHKDNSLAETMMLVTDGGDRTVDLKYTTDGKESSQDIMGTTGQTVVKWETDGWLIEWKAEGRSFVRKLTLSADGKSMTMIVKQISPDGETVTDSVVLEKQEAK
ncbi:MAG: hypothetical protein JNK38_11500 [Acidobacteria bacterium]|nr:hypothetical protein [Acidobacteriota bacterium]